MDVVWIVLLIALGYCAGAISIAYAWASDEREWRRKFRELEEAYLELAWEERGTYPSPFQPASWDEEEARLRRLDRKA